MNKITICRYLAHGYMICSILGVALLISSYNIAIILLGIGASSAYIAFGVFLAANVCRFWGISALLWSMLFPILLIVSYIFALKKRYRLLLVSISVDFLVVLLFAVYSLLTNNGHGLHFAIIDSIMSFMFLFLFLKTLRMAK